MNIATLADKDLNGADATGGIIKLAMLAVGGQGGGVLTDWIVALAEANGLSRSVDIGGGRRTAGDHRCDHLLCRNGTRHRPRTGIRPDAVCR